jgi:DNA-binding transcriptional LysR family regulator
MRLPLDHVATMVLFAQVVTARSFTEAARRVGITKSSVSRRIARLEEALGVRLLRRTTRKLALTEEGMRFYEHCARLVAEADAAAEAASGASRELRGGLRVSAPVTLSQLHLARAIAGFLTAHPTITVELVADDARVDVVAGGFDVVVRMGRLAPSTLVARRLAADRLIVCGAPAYLARAGVPASPGDLLSHDCLHYTRVPSAGEWRFGADPLPVRGSLATSDGTVLREAAVAGLGLIVVPRFMVARELTTGALVAVLEGLRRARIGIYAVTAAGRQQPRRARALVDWLVAAFKDAEGFGG